MAGKKDITRVGKIIDELDGQLNIRSRKKEYEALRQWPDIVGTEVAEHTKPLYIAEKFLYIKCDGSVWSQEISFRKNEIIRKINDFLGFVAVMDIRYKVR
jgi:hypothetical protein